MLNPKLKLNPKIFNADCEQVPIRKGFGEGLLRAGELDKNVVALCADLTESTQMIFFKEKFPERFVEIGVAEQNLATVASGMAAMGKISFISSYAMFSPGRNWEQIRTTIAYNDRKVVVVGSHGGISVGADGGTHQALEDIALMRVIPNMDVVSPCDSIEAKKATLALGTSKRPAYLRLARDKTPIITTEETPFALGKAEIYWLPEVGLAQVGIIATGSLMHRALLAAKELESGEESQRIKTKVMNLSGIKPIDKNAIITLARETKRIVTVEEHQVAGGMGSAVAEILAQNFPVPIEFIGVQDKFGQSGTPDELVEHYGMGVQFVKEAVKKVLGRK
ncbi:transketolase [Candidatus Nomurabacteria bacterium RIFCSPHIGHO2_01_FULL_39_220]|uniref:Transketolase n=1 Tax=Candidatus Nomurabacteria bacterium RIFCSPLOWO2_02_FULL_40_67 TaxID=1801787 RepID=A0A1F6Y3T3_9BACT|nr:MAG: Transketolase, central region [Parcubacteria group bacterium GW2011_GWA2_40_37]KKS12160.1 MAG: Transketolase, central region [Parcubacteria group bacterium GW2011_GWB1_41_5]OGI61876.1 MAG: transketolase [Candidatus Nomurabacteria bacterium RBG_16_40_11]OGI69343.1 MAG: transketolase [Candidatus Nomurabacteria bacterium RIFCSPHIGHO2_01_FULL_39_220]OGI72834.1 MAG: transketolase [Candidatus Nomurabacteria bacterium RIFCSPHIGHO2_02_41_18]OGI78324.1 MAG: transketolase [Candidatus Nomurabacte